MNFSLNKVKSLVEEVAADPPATEIDWLDEIYDVTVPEITGHTNPYYALFFTLTEYYKPKVVVELGSWRAYAAAHFAAGNSDTQVFTVDIHKDDQVAHRIAQEVAGNMDNLTFIHGWTWDVVDQFDDKSIDILFIDAWHEYEYVVREWELYEPKLSNNALVIMDDIFDAAGATVDMVKAWEEISGDYQSFLSGDVHDGIPMGFFKFVRSQPKPKSKKTKK